MFTKLQAHFHYTTATLLAIIAAAITVATTLGLNVSANLRDAILQLAGLVLGGIVVGGGVKSSGLLQAGIHPIQKAAARETQNQLREQIGVFSPLGRAEHDAPAGGVVTVSLEHADEEDWSPRKPRAARPKSGHSIHPILQVHGTFENMPLGKREARFDPRTPVLGEFLVADTKLGIKLPKATTLLDEIADMLGGDFGMMGNDTYGDCTCAALGHAEQEWSGVHGAVVTLTAADILNGLYWPTGNPPTPGADDNGRVMFDVLKYAHHNSLPGGHQIGAYVAVGLRRYAHRDVRAAIDLFGGCYLGVGLPTSAQSQAVWDVTGDPRKPGPAAWGSWGGHAIWLGEYDHEGPTCVTWAHKLKMTWRFLDAYADEGYAIISPDWLAGGKSPQGFDGAALTAYLQTIKQGWQPPQ